MVILIDAWVSQDEKETEAYSVPDNMMEQLLAYHTQQTTPSDPVVAAALPNIVEELGLMTKGYLTKQDRKAVTAHFVRTHGQKVDIPRWSCTLF